MFVEVGHGAFCAESQLPVERYTQLIGMNICKTGLSTELDGKQILPEHADASGKGPEVRAAPRSE